MVDLEDGRETRADTVHEKHFLLMWTNLFIHSGCASNGRLGYKTIKQKTFHSAHITGITNYAHSSVR